MAAVAENEKVPRFPRGSLKVLEEIIMHGDGGPCVTVATAPTWPKRKPGTLSPGGSVRYFLGPNVPLS